MSMYTDPNHIKIEDPGQTEGNPVFIYLDALCKDREKYLELKEHYEKGGLGDVTVKKYLIEVIEEILKPIREKRKYYENHKEEVYEILNRGGEKAREKASQTLNRVKDNMGINYFK